MPSAVKKAAKRALTAVGLAPATTVEGLKAENAALRTKLAKLQNRNDVLAERVVRNKEARRDYRKAYRSILGELGQEKPLNIPTDDELFAQRTAAKLLTTFGIPLQDAMRGERFDRALVREARAQLVRRPYSKEPRQFAAILERASLNEDSVLGYTHMGNIIRATVLALLVQDYATAWDLFSKAPLRTVLQLTPEEYLKTQLEIAPEGAATTVEALLTTEEVTSEQLLQLAGYLVVHGRRDLAATLVAESEKRDPNGDLTDKRGEILPWLAEKTDFSAPSANPAAISFGIIDYKQPDLSHSSKNLGDHVQTIASLGHLTRQKNFTFSGPEGVVEFVEKLKSRVKPERVIDGPAAELNLVPLSRDANDLQEVPENTWALAFGWYLHSRFDINWGLPFNKNVRPIFLSVHINRIGLLTPDAIEYLKKYSPVGCRDWNTVHLLNAAGVPAFFSGCITTTVDTSFPAFDHSVDRSKKPVLFVDTPVDLELPNTEYWAQEDEGVRVTSFVQNLHDALGKLDSYQNDYSAVIAKRLHAYLPSRSIGVDATFKPRNPSDVRFDGLYGITDEAFEAIRTGILEKLAQVTTAIASGKSEDEVYALWRSLTQPEVDKALALRDAVQPFEGPSFSVAEAIAQVHSEMRDMPALTPRAGEPMNVEISLDANFKQQMYVGVESILQNTERPVHFWVLCREHEESDYLTVQKLFPEAHFTWLPCDHVNYGEDIRLIEHISVSTMDRLLLPELLPDLDRVIHFDLDAICLGDLGELYDFDLAGARFAARVSPMIGVRDGFNQWWRESARLEERTDVAHDLILRTHGLHKFGFKAINAGFTVLNLDRMRQENFCNAYLPFAEVFGMHDQNVLMTYGGDQIAHLPAEWNTLPMFERVDDAKIIHWAGKYKPWGEYYLLGNEHWDATRDAVNARLATIQG